MGSLADFLSSQGFAQFAGGLKQFGDADTARRDKEHMMKVFAANPEFAKTLYGTQSAMDENKTRSALAQLEFRKQQLEENKQSALANLTPDLASGNIEKFLTQAAPYDPRYASALIEYKTEQGKAQQPDWQVKEVNGQLVRYDAKNPDAGVVTMTGGGQPLPDVKGESELRKEFDSLNKDFRTINDSYNKITEVSKNPSAAGDISLIFSYMKMLDPSSTVREGEFATAQNAAGVPTQVQNVWNRAVSGERLAPEQRIDFVNQAKNLYTAQSSSYSSGVDKYRGLAKDYGFNPDRIVKPLSIKNANSDIEKQKAELRAKISALKGKR